MTVTVLGADRLARALHSVADGLAHLAPTNAAAARLALAAAHPPRRTGALAASGRATGDDQGGLVKFGAGLDYAVVVHNGSPARGIPARPFAVDALEATQPAWLALYTHRVSALLDRT